MAIFGVDFAALLESIKRTLKSGSESTPNETGQVEAHYYEAASVLVTELLSACRANDGVRGGGIARFIHESRDLHLLMMVLGILSSQVVSAERSHPLRGMSIEELNMLCSDQGEAWVTSAMDQLSAAAENCDYEAFGDIAVDSHLRAIHRDKTLHGESLVDFNYVQRALSVIDGQTLSIIAAKLLLRLADENERE